MKSEKKVLFLCDRFGLASDANGICVKKVAGEFKRRGYHIFCIFNSETEDCSFSADGMDFIGVKRTLYDSLSCKLQNKNFIFSLIFFLFSFLRHIALIPFYPNVSPFRSRRYKKEAFSLIDSENIGLVIAAYRPYESLYSLMRIKRKYGKKTFCVAYHLDILTSPNTKNKVIRNCQIKKLRKIFEKECGALDLIVLPSILENKVTSLSNIKYADFPVCDSSEKECSFVLPYDCSCVNMVYIGTLNTDNRNPECAIKFIEKLSEKVGRKIQFHIWGNMDMSVTELFKKSATVFYHGLLAPENVMYALKNSDFIVNIANEQTPQMVPSKIFQYFSTHKPIINILSCDNDASIRFFDKYGFALNIWKRDPLETNIQKGKFFIEHLEEFQSRIDESFLYKSTPAFFVDTVENENHI